MNAGDAGGMNGMDGMDGMDGADGAGQDGARPPCPAGERAPPGFSLLEHAAMASHAFRLAAEAVRGGIPGLGRAFAECAALCAGAGGEGEAAQAAERALAGPPEGLADGLGRAARLIRPPAQDAFDGPATARRARTRAGDLRITRRQGLTLAMAMLEAARHESLTAEPGLTSPALRAASLCGLGARWAEAVGAHEAARLARAAKDAAGEGPKAVAEIADRAVMALPGRLRGAEGP